MKTPFLVLGLLLGLVLPSARAANIVALCIGNDAYARAEDVLDTPVADAKLMRHSLSVLQENDILRSTDVSRVDLRQSLRSIESKAAAAKLAIVFYSGYGMEETPVAEDRPETFLLTVGADISGLDIDENALSLIPINVRCVFL